MNWAEERKPEELPEYVKRPDSDGGEVRKIGTYGTHYNEVFYQEPTYWLPATLEEYEAFKNQQK